MISPRLPEQPSLEAALRQIAIFSDLTDDQLRWFASSGEELRLAPGEALLHEGDPADALFVLLEGEMRGRRENGGGDGPAFVGRAGEVTGMLPFSRMTTFSLTARATAPSWILRLHKDHFPEMLERIPKLLPRLVGVLADRIREYSRAEQQRDKLSALGKLSAGLAHELNNPASAAGRAAEGLREYMRELRRINKLLDETSLSCEERSSLASLEEHLLDQLASATPRDALEQSDLEEELVSWLNRRSIPNAPRLASGLIEAGVDRAALEKLGAKFRGEVLSRILSRVVSSVGAERLTREIEASTGRISELVRAIKEYTYMDQAPEQEVDVHRGIESTLTMLKFRLKHGVDVKRDFDPALPRVFAHGSELNQIWTNLIDNAIDAMGGKGELRIRTSRELDFLLVEIIDNGPGIPDSVKPHIFEPFFTTKGVGEGTGMGLDTVYRIVRSHRGEISVDSKPGRTSFQVRLPLKA
ncbi:MAG: cyclic nucleotide-binding protein [Bryobacterales bacterium]|nr:cyclic nucleotide-binding protein [Bryobacterales bacterium]